VFAQLGDAEAQVLEHVLGGGELDAPLDEDRVDRCVLGGGGVGEDPGGDCRPGKNGAEDGDAGASHYDGVLPPVVLLEGEGERDVVGWRDGWVREPEVRRAADELEVTEAEAGDAPSRAGHREVLTGSQGKEEGPAGQLGEGARVVGRRRLGEVPEEAGRYGSLLVLAGVGVGVAPELSSKKAVQSEGACMGGAGAAVCPVGRHHTVEGVSAGSGGAGGSVAESREPAGAVCVDKGANNFAQRS
jgi:hypothetical protein